MSDKRSGESERKTLYRTGEVKESEGAHKKSGRLFDKNLSADGGGEFSSRKGGDGDGKGGFFAFLIEKRREKNRKKLAQPPRYGRVVFEVEGMNFSRLINALNRETDLKNVSVKGRVLRFDARAKHCGKIIAILDRLWYDYKIIKVYGSAPLAFALAKRGGAVLGLICVVAALCLYPNFVTDISFSGEADQSVYDILESYGVKKGAFLTSFNESELESRLLALDGVAFASVTKSGTHVYVTVKPEQSPHDFVDVGGNPVIAKRLASVTRVVVYGGTAEVKYGDIVRAGDVLIGDYVTVGDQKVPASASGAVYGKIYYEKTLFFADVLNVREYGESRTFSKLSLLGSTPKPPEAPFKQYELSVTVQKNGFLLPFARYTWKYTEIKYVQKENTFSEEEMIERTRSAALTETAAEAVVLALYDTVTRATDGYHVKVIIETEERID